MITDFIASSIRNFVRRYPIISIITSMILIMFIMKSLIGSYPRFSFVFFPITSILLFWILNDYLNRVNDGSVDLDSYKFNRMKFNLPMSIMMLYFVFTVLSNNIFTKFGEEYIPGFYYTIEEENHLTPEGDIDYTSYTYYSSNKIWEHVLNYYSLVYFILSVVLSVSIYSKVNEKVNEMLKKIN